VYRLKYLFSLFLWWARAQSQTNNGSPEEKSSKVSPYSVGFLSDHFLVGSPKVEWTRGREDRQTDLWAWKWKSKISVFKRNNSDQKNRLLGWRDPVGIEGDKKRNNLSAWRTTQSHQSDGKQCFCLLEYWSHSAKEIIRGKIASDLLRELLDRVFRFLIIFAYLVDWIKGNRVIYHIYLELATSCSDSHGNREIFRNVSPRIIGIIKCLVQ
jgi:hypothetical protein